MSVTTFEKWLARGMPRIEAGGYDLDECQQFITIWKTESGQGDDDESTSELRERRLLAECDKIEQDARQKRLKNDETEGLLYPAYEVKQWIASRLLRIRSRLVAVPNEMQNLAPSQIRAQFRTDMDLFIHGLLLEIGGWENDPNGFSIDDSDGNNTDA